MTFDSLAFKNEFIDVLTFWDENLEKQPTDFFLKEMSIKQEVDHSALLGSMYLARIIYGASVACKELNALDYIHLADKAYDLLQEKFVNPAGGYYWAKKNDETLVHSSENINLGQSFVLYGLAEYASLKKNDLIDQVAQKQADFIASTILDKTYGGYLDGFDINWESLKDQDKALGTHLHMLEAYTKWYEYTQNEKYVPLIANLIRIIIDRFIDAESLDCIHRLNSDWTILPNEIWAGHNAECSWIICNASRIINDEKLLEECNVLALQMMDQVIEYAYDKENGAVSNVLENGKPTEDFISWWPPAETVIGLINAYQISGNEQYLNLALQSKLYISNNMVSPCGEWYSAVDLSGNPMADEPLIHFWKSMYHNVRYYVEVLNRLN